MKKLSILSAVLLTASLLSPVRATDYTVEPTTAIKSTTLPVFINSASLIGSLTQQIILAEELEGASAGNITAISFYYGLRSGKSSVNAMTRSIQIWLLEVPSSGVSKVDSFAIALHGTEYVSKFLCNGSGKAGTKVYEGDLATSAISSDYSAKKVTLQLSSPFEWDGSSNLVMTVIDMSSTTVGDDAKTNLQFYISATDHPRFAHKTWLYGGTDDRATLISNLTDQYCIPYSTNTLAKQISGRRYVPKTTFTIETPVPAPTEPNASSITKNAATLGWTAAAGAESYEVRYGTTSGSLGAATNVGDVTSYDLSGLEEGTTYYWQVRTIIGSASSEWTDEENFTTTADSHEHNGVSFSKWSSANSLPTSGSYYLNSDVTFDLLASNVTLSGDLKLCLNGKTANLNGARIIVPDNKTLTIYDNEGGGKITSFFPSSDGAMLSSGLITVENGGTLIISEGAIDNTYIPDADGTSIAICGQVGSVVRLSGAPSISSNAIDFFIGNSTAITIAGALSNAAPYKVYKVLTGDFTSGWSTYMSGADPTEYFTSANASFGVCLNGSEARMVKALSFDGANNNNTAITDNNGQLVNVKLANRTFTSASYNTICLPFALTDAQLQDIFGSGYDLEAFVSSSLEGEELELAFTKVYSLTAGKPYLIKPSADAVNPSFTGVTISATSPAAETEDAYIWFYGVYAPTELEANNKNLLFLGANNTLYWPSVTGNIKGFRAYFNVRGAAQQCASRARIVQASDAATSTEAAKAHEAKSSKLIQDGQIYIEHNGVRYNTMGQKVQ